MMKDIARKSALNAVNEIIKAGAYGNLAIKTQFNNLSEMDRRFATRLTYGTIEKLITLDWILGHYLKKTTPITVKNILRMGTYQIYYMDSVPHQAACSTSVDLAKAIGKKGASGFINAVLRNVARGKDQLSMPSNDNDPVLAMSVQYSCPKWLVALWIDEMGIEATDKLLRYQPAYNITIRPNACREYTAEQLEAWLSTQSVAYIRGNLADASFKIQSSYNIIDTPLFQSGQIAVQDEGSMVIAMQTLLSNPKTVLDVCAAPGGKTAAMAHFNSTAQYYATELHKHRVELMEKQFDRLGVIAKTYRFDATKKAFDINVDVILADVPCSGLGTIHKQPDIKYAKDLQQIKDLTKIQREILNQCAEAVNAEGVLIYSTCTISKRENYDIVQDFLNTHPEFEVIPPEDPILLEAFDGLGVQLLPYIHDTAGFYFARMRKIT